MFNINDIKNGMTFVLDGQIYQVLEFLHVKPGKGPAFIRTKIKNLRTGATIEKTFNTNIKLEKAIIDKQNAQYLYNSGDVYNFMNMETYEQIELTKEQLGDDALLLKENLEVDLSFYNGELIGIILPDKIQMKVVHTEPGVKGNTATNATKDAELESGLVVRVPLFIEQGEDIIITREGKYDSRA
ncbi:MAG: elongation factor P [Candidatus Faecisoma sp.]|jgi:elongation factor P|nr:elongation factor P [Acholeplasma sp.]MCI5677919.1 elongation factor P [Acholeplasma sp.]MDY2892786.1 elongation factor P [Candidatus Faecisoma sp.]CCY27878.1 elongation factor P [Acholeplasma sp. CAG:878]